MQIDTYNFVFHPFHESHSSYETTLSIITNIALTILSCGLYLFVFTASRSFEWLAGAPLLATTITAPLPFAADVAAIDKMPRDRFVGVQNLQKKQANHLARLENLANSGFWEPLQHHTLHDDSGFDWWMFPINQPSKGQVEKYNLPLEAIEKLKDDPAFMENYRKGVTLVAKSWGWDLSTGQLIQNNLLCWRGYDIRLQKMKTSLALFDEPFLLQRLERFEKSVK